MQTVISQRMSIPFEAPPLNLYRSLRVLNPSPYMYFLDLEDFHIVGSSPEILARVEDEEVTVRPIAGTRKRGATDADGAGVFAAMAWIEHHPVAGHDHPGPFLRGQLHRLHG